MTGWTRRLWNQLYRPYLLGFGGLAFAVALWGFGYKLSLYHRNPAQAQRAIVAKLWSEPPNASVVAVQKLKNQSTFIASPAALCSSIQSPLLDDAAVCLLLPKVAVVQSFDFPTLLRSPPQSFRSA